MIILILLAIITFIVIKTILDRKKKGNESYEDTNLALTDNGAYKKKVVKRYCPLSLSLDDPVMDGYNIGKMDRYAPVLQAGNLDIKQTVKYPKPYENFRMAYQK